MHSTWNHISRIELPMCANPLHGGHYVPRMRPAPGHGGFFELAAKYLDKTYSLVDRKLGLHVDVPSTYAAIFSDIVWEKNDATVVDDETTPDSEDR